MKKFVNHTWKFKRMKTTTRYLTRNDVNQMTQSQLIEEAVILAEAIDGLTVMIDTANKLGDVDLASDMRNNLKFSTMNKRIVDLKIKKNNQLFIYGEYETICLN